MTRSYLKIVPDAQKPKAPAVRFALQGARREGATFWLRLGDEGEPESPSVPASGTATAAQAGPG